MCGRFNIVDDPLVKFTSDFLGLDFNTSSNSNVCPSDSIATVTSIENQIVQINANWGIKPSWSKKLLINAQSETVDSKKTFQSAYRYHRCVIPFSGWYEWKAKTSKSEPETNTGSSTEVPVRKNSKQKYLFEKKGQPLFMAAILFQQSPENYNKLELVSLTTEANEICKPIHNRMPLLIEYSNIVDWLTKDIIEIDNLLRSKTSGINFKLV